MKLEKYEIKYINLQLKSALLAFKYVLNDISLFEVTEINFNYTT